MIRIDRPNQHVTFVHGTRFELIKVFNALVVYYDLRGKRLIDASKQVPHIYEKGWLMLDSRYALFLNRLTEYNEAGII